MKLFQSSRWVVVKSFRALSQSLVIMTDAQLHFNCGVLWLCYSIFPFSGLSWAALPSSKHLQVTLRRVRHLWAMCRVTRAASQRLWMWREGGGGITHTRPQHPLQPLPSPQSFFFIYIFAHNDPRRVHFQIRPGSSAPRRQFYVVADPGLWSRCLGSDNIMTESAGVTRRHGRTNRHMQRHILYVGAAGWPWLFVRRRTMTSHNKGLVFCAYSCRWAPAAQNEKPPSGAAGSLSLANVTKRHIILLLLLLLWSLTLHCSS